ncbi:serine/threonine-protein phosphatase, partial [Pseudomonas aeruginosa]|nr:serine/threonine-protein phosphatase [Pseudomonas aeruginosa]MBT9113372.1 serine/threonine-protein phosphatase [Pseudomonas aeruginosa]
MVPNSVSYYRSASYSHVGMVRKVNEDASLDAPESGLWVV